MKQINTGKAEILLIQVPDGAYNFTNEMASHQIDYLEDSNFNGEILTISSCIILREYWGEQLEILGLSHMLTEEQCTDLMPLKDNYTAQSVDPYKYKHNQNPNRSYRTAKDALRGLMYEAEAYDVNPLGDPPHNIGLIDLYPFGHPIMDGSMECAIKWKKAQENTGKWLILEKGRG